MTFRSTGLSAIEAAWLRIAQRLQDLFAVTASLVVLETENSDHARASEFAQLAKLIVPRANLE